MSRHARTSPASLILKLCNDTTEPLSDSDIKIFRSLILDNPEISDNTKFKIIDMVTVILIRHEQYKTAVSNLQEILDSIGVELD